MQIGVRSALSIERVQIAMREQSEQREEVYLKWASTFATLEQEIQKQSQQEQYVG